MKLITALIIFSIISLAFSCSKNGDLPDNEKLDIDSVTKKLLGSWHEVAPRDMISALRACFYENDTLVIIDGKWEPNFKPERVAYKVYSIDSLIIYRNKRIITKHKLIFYRSDSLKITKFADIDLIWGYMDIVLLKNKQ